MLASKGIRLEIQSYERKQIPSEPPFAIVANECLPGFDDLFLLRFLLPLNLPIRLITLSNNNHHRHPILHPFYQQTFFQQENHNNFYSTISKLRTAIRHCRQQEVVPVLLLDFTLLRPGKVRKYVKNRRILSDLRKAGLPIVPCSLSSDRLQPEGALVTIRAGKPISLEEQQAFRRSFRFSNYLQSRIFALGSSLEVRRFFFPADQSGQLQEIAPPASPDTIREEIRNLPPEALIASRAQFDIYVAAAPQIPESLNEIGRLREVTFRQVGEGTGRSRDLDEYDIYYRQLIIWDRKEGRIAGGYRLGCGDEIFPRFGIEGFYIHSLFKIRSGFYPILKQGVELGRSYILPEYQKQRLPLFLLWKGILHFLIRHPQYRYLCGPLSISKHYSDLSKSLIVEFVRQNYFDHNLARYVEARKPFRVKLKRVNVEVLMENMQGELERLDHFVEDIEPSHFRLPVLLKQYVRQNARFVGFNIDPNFSDVLDGLMVLNLEDVPAGTIEALRKE